MGLYIYKKGKFYSQPRYVYRIGIGVFVSFICIFSLTRSAMMLSPLMIPSLFFPAASFTPTVTMTLTETAIPSTAAPTDTLTSTPLPTDTSIFTPTDTPLPTNTDTPLPTNTDTPTLAPTSTSAPSTTPVIECTGIVADQFRAVWPQLKATLGCPGHLTNTTLFAYQDFQHGKIIWRGKEIDGNDPNMGTGLVLYDDDTWQLLEITYNTNDPATCPQLQPQQSALTPRQGFAKLLCKLADVRDKLGAATIPGQGYPTSFVQQFDNGFLLHYHLVNNTWRTIAFIYGADQKSGTWQQF